MAKRCPLCHVRPTAIGWCGACRSSYRSKNLSHANVMEVAQWGADRAREAIKETKRFEATLEHAAQALKAGNG